jgi:hypothetical protein
MIRIIINRVAYRALSGAEPPERGGYALWLTNPVLARLRGARGNGEDHSDVIVRLAEVA